MDKSLLLDLQETTKALKAAIMRSQNGIAGLVNISKLGSAAIGTAAPNIFNELRQLETDMQKFLRTYKDQLNKASLSTSKLAGKETQE